MLFFKPKQTPLFLLRPLPFPAFHFLTSVPVPNSKFRHDLLDAHTALIGNQTHEDGADIAELIVVVKEADVGCYGLVGGGGSGGGRRGRGLVEVE